MFPSWLQHLVRQKKSQPTLQGSVIAPVSHTWENSIPAYQEALTKLDAQDSDTLLATLLVRDQLEAKRQRETTNNVQAAKQLIKLDALLREKVSEPFMPSLSSWRQSLCPPEAHWWWFLDKAAAEKEKVKDFLWQILAVTLFVLTVPLATDIIRRLWSHAPDNVAIVSTLLTLLITTSPFTKNGRELITWLLRRFPRLPTHRHAETMATMAFIAFLLIAGLRFIYLPQLHIPVKTITDSGPWRSLRPEQSDQSKGDNAG